MNVSDVEALNRDFEHTDPKSILRWAAESFGDRLAIVTSLQPTGIIVLHMLNELRVRPSVLTLDTGLLFPETYGLMDEVESRFGINLTRIQPVLSVEAQNETYGEALWTHNPDQCCKMRKVIPLDAALDKTYYSAWVAGLRRDQPGRALVPLVSWDHKHGMVKLAPLANWDERMVWTYIHAHELPYNRLHDRGYPSIGCHTCTHPTALENNSRAGRWVGHAKTECGLHSGQALS